MGGRVGRKVGGWEGREAGWVGGRERGEEERDMLASPSLSFSPLSLPLSLSSRLSCTEERVQERKV